jgi:hypothetical protein
MANTLLGVDLTDTPTALNNTAFEQQGHALGTVHVDHRGYRWMYVRAEGALAVGTVVAIDELFDARPITKALADAGEKIGVSQVVAADEDFCWVLIYGIGQALVLSLCAADVALYTCATAGSLDDASASQTQIRGIVLTTARGGTDGLAPCRLTTEPFSL